jgi:hypothetical protein
MNYYVWVMAKGANELVSEPALVSSFEFFAGTWQPFNEEGDWYHISNNGTLVYSAADLAFEGSIRAVIPCGERSVNNNPPAPSYILILEYARDALQNFPTTPNKYFGALYVHTAEGTGGLNSRARMGAARDPAAHGPADYDCEAATLAEALERFTFEALGSYYDASADTGYKKTALPAFP